MTKKCIDDTGNAETANSARRRFIVAAATVTTMLSLASCQNTVNLSHGLADTEPSPAVAKKSYMNRYCFCGGF